MQRRINVSLSEESLRLLDRLAPRGDRSRYIEQLVRRSAQERNELRRLLKERAIRRADLDRQLAAEWDSLSDEVWRQLDRE
ncbi:MAG: hypothetical protein A3J75_01325 [Acidobacteria bacterium RBG_16_68_9]|nr:MAG: hypothetical protein A3J75_01325 [Acidobacteria bacterium RBG_16_68_9]